jgi:hypothetical protein
MEFYTYDGVNLVLPDIAGTFGVSQDQASWILTTYISACCSMCRRRSGWPGMSVEATVTIKSPPRWLALLL